MATTKLWHISGRIEDVIDYAENPEKTCPIPDLEDLWNAARYAERPEATADGQYVTAINCTRETAVKQMILTKQQLPSSSTPPASTARPPLWSLKRCIRMIWKSWSMRIWKTPIRL